MQELDCASKETTYVLYGLFSIIFYIFAMQGEGGFFQFWHKYGIVGNLQVLGFIIFFSFGFVFNGWIHSGFKEVFKEKSLKFMSYKKFQCILNFILLMYCLLGFIRVYFDIPLKYLF